MNGIHLVNGGVSTEFFGIVRRILSEYLSARGCVLSQDGLPVTLTKDDNLSEDEYDISTQRVISASSRAGFLAGMGRFLRESAFDGEGHFAPPAGAFHLKPAKPIRGMYFATHFSNFYHVAPLEEIYELIDSLALRGCNALMTWYDMHHYSGIDDPESILMIRRLKAVFTYARSLGMRLCLTMLANEAFRGTPDALKADWRAVNGYKYSPIGHFHVEICPSVPGGMEEILRQRRQVLEAFADVPLDYISYWPYDQGGCTCAKCAPWGGNGFLKIAPEFNRLVREIMPDVQLLCSTWRFDAFVSGEWELFREKINSGAYDFFSYLFDYFESEEAVPDFIRSGELPGGLKLLSFPEICMRGAVPWGGFGANPMPEHLNETERRTGTLYDGCFPYSEGLFDDINKALMLGFASGQYKSAHDILCEYARSEFCAPRPEEIVSILYDMEETLPRDRLDENGEEQNYLRRSMPPETVYHFVFHNPQKVDDIYRRTLEADASLPVRVRSLWRWRIIYLRAMIDHEILHNGGQTNPECERYYAELAHIYHAENAEYCVAPPSEESMRLNRGGFLL